MNGYSSHRAAGTLLKRLRVSSDDYSDVLLPTDGPVAASAAFLLASELKFFDSYLDTTEVSEGPLSFALCVLSAYSSPQACVCVPLVGDRYIDRDNDVILLKSWQFKCTISSNSLTNGTKLPAPRLVFVALVLDTLTNKAQCGADKIWWNQSGSGSQLMNLLRNPLFGKRFQVLRQEVFDLNCVSSSVSSTVTPDEVAAQGKALAFEWFLNLDIPVRFAANTGAITDVVDNSLHVCAVALPSGGVVPENWQRVYIDYQSRVRFLSHP